MNNPFKIGWKLVAGSLIFLLGASSCKQYEGGHELFELMENTGVDFINKVEDGREENSFQFRNFYNGGGVAIGDLNNDGLPDIVLTSNQGTNSVYLNKGDFKFENITKGSGLIHRGQWSTGVTLVDINHDGWLDIYICNSGHMFGNGRKNELYINNHNLTFTESAASYGLDHSGYCTQAAFFDYDLDGDLDCFIIDNSPIPFSTLNYANMRDSAESAWKVPDYLRGGGNHLLRNDNGHFIEVTASAGIHTSLISFGLGISVSDINGDGYPDIYVGNDFLERDYLYINQKDGTFRDELPGWTQHISMSSMGTDIADINNDGYPDIYTTDMLPEDDYRFKTTGVYDNVNLYRSKIKAGYYQQFVRNCLQLNNSNGKFIDIANYSGVAATDWSWGLVLFDADNDGYNDIYVCNGINHDLGNLDFLDFFSNDIYQAMQQNGQREDMVKGIIDKIPKTPLRNKAYRNLGNLKFADIGDAWGFSQLSYSNSVAYADLDNDGALDLVVNNENQPVFIYKNNGRKINQNNYIGITLKGTKENPFAIGSKVMIYANDQIICREQEPVRGFQSSVDYKLTIGLGKISRVDSMMIEWPDRSITKYQQPELNKSWTIVESDSSVKKETAESALNEPPLLIRKNSHFDKHQEDDYVDFYHEANIPELLSRQGPKAAVGDVNGDKLDDIFIGGASGQAGQLYLQNRDGSFQKKPEPAFELFAGFEDVPVLFFDCDGDGDLDLFVGSGGNKTPLNSRELQHRLYINDGKGNFSLNPDAFPASSANSSIALAVDLDNDGDLDLFVGSRSVPMQYGLDPESHVYINDGHGLFSELPRSRMGGIDHAGMITGAAWSDLLGSGTGQLILVGDWMPPRIYSYANGEFKEVHTSLDSLFGWWRSVAVSDLDGDGKPDLVLGNIGENFYLHPDLQNPVKLWINDFDGNNVLDKIMTHTVNGNDMPIFLKHEMEAQLPMLKKQNLLHKDFAKKSIHELFSSQTLEMTKVKEFNYTSSIIALNKGQGKFLVRALPTMAQLSSINAIYCQDLDGDGLPDLILGGNDFGFTPQFGRLDGSLGIVLLNKNHGDFNAEDSRQSGIQETGQIADIKLVVIENKKYFLILQNNDYPVLYEWNERKRPFRKM
jgi:hypothetical protein